MPIDHNLPFIRNRITEIGSALLFSLSNELIRFPASIISVLKVDDDGHLWFFAKRPVMHLSQQEQCFPARLQFYRKGKPFYVEVVGFASVAEDKEIINGFSGIQTELADIAMQNLMLVKLKINKAIYHEPKAVRRPKNFVEDIRAFCAKRFRPSYNYRSFEVNAEAI